nr:hypothetical protein [Tanacetum cinerariifolium]
MMKYIQIKPPKTCIIKALSDIEETQTHHSTKTQTKEPVSQEHQSPSPPNEQLESSKAKETDASDSESSSCFKTLKPYDNYIIDDFYSTTFKKYENIDNAHRNYQQILSLFKTDHNTCIRRILDCLREVQNAIKEDPTLNKKFLEAYTKNFTNLTELLTMKRRIDDIDQDEDITLVNDVDHEMFDVDDLGGEEVFVAEQEVVQDEQERLDEEAAKRLQAKFNEEEILAREKAQKEQEAYIALIETWDDIQAKIDANHQLAERFQAQEQEDLSDVETATLFQQLLEKRTMHFTAKRA